MVGNMEVRIEEDKLDRWVMATRYRGKVDT